MATVSRLAAVATVAVALGAAAPGQSRSHGSAHRAAPVGLLRVDQAGYLPGEPKLAFLMTSTPVSSERYQVVEQSASGGTVVASGAVPATSRGTWNAAYRDVYPIDFSPVRAAGSYRLRVDGPIASDSAPFPIERARALYGPIVSDGVNFFRNQRDGLDVIPGALHRRPSHLHDARAFVYAAPRFEPDGSDVIVGSLRRIGGPVDVEGGWADAGDDLKFTFTAAYADDLLYAAARALGSSAPRSLLAEARYGTRWLDRMWQPQTRTLYLQVGIGSGNEKTFYGDHDLWRLPQRDDSDHRFADRFATSHRPVFEAAPPGSTIAPDIVGRAAAAFAFAAQADARADRMRAIAELQRATSLYAIANTHPGSPLESTLPSAYYPESIWHDAMELAATEIVLAQQDLGGSAATYRPYLLAASRWAADYIAHDAGRDTLNLYDVSALAHADLVTAIAHVGTPTGLAVTKAELTDDVEAQLAARSQAAARSIFELGGDETNFDVDSHTFGLISTEALYQRLTGDTRFAAFATDQRGWLFGANPWGESFMVGIGASFPHCMQSQIANLSGSLDGRPPIDAGAVVNGPNGKSLFAGGLGGLQTGMRRCVNDGGRAYTGHGAEFLDNVRVWQTDEPALDMTGSAILAAALQESLAP